MIFRKIVAAFAGVLTGAVLVGAVWAGDYITQVLVTVKDDKLMAFSAYANNWVRYNLYLKENVVSKNADGNLAVVVTNKRLVAFSVFTNRWEVEDLKLDETVQDIQVEGNAAVVTTNKRVMGFNAHSGHWLETP